MPQNTNLNVSPSFFITFIISVDSPISFPTTFPLSLIPCSLLFVLTTCNILPSFFVVFFLFHLHKIAWYAVTLQYLVYKQRACLKPRAAKKNKNKFKRERKIQSNQFKLRPREAEVLPTRSGVSSKSRSSFQSFSRQRPKSRG